MIGSVDNFRLFLVILKIFSVDDSVSIYIYNMVYLSLGDDGRRRGLERLLDVAAVARVQEVVRHLRLLRRYHLAWGNT